MKSKTKLNKLIIMIIIISLLNAISVLALEKEDCQNILNLPTEKIKLCINEKKINLNELNEETLFQLLKEQTDITLSNIEEIDLKRVLVKYPDLLDINPILERYEEIIVRDNSFLKESLDLQIKWLSSYKISTKNCKANFADGKNIVFKKLTINKTNIENITINDRCEALINNNTVKVISGIIKKQSSNELEIEGYILAPALINIKPTSEPFDIHFVNARLITPKYVFQSRKDGKLKISDKTIQIKGKNIYIIEKYKHKYTIEGTIEIEEEKITLKKDGILNFVDNKIQHTTVKTTENLEIRETCGDKKINCISFENDKNDPLLNIFKEYQEAKDKDKYLQQKIKEYIETNAKVNFDSSSGKAVSEIETIIESAKEPNFNLATYLEKRELELDQEQDPIEKISNELVVDIFKEIKSKKSNNNLVKELEKIKKRIIVNNYILSDYDKNTRKLKLINRFLEHDTENKYLKINPPLYRKNIFVNSANGIIEIQDNVNNLNEIYLSYDAEKKENEGKIIIKGINNIEIQSNKKELNFDGNPRKFHATIIKKHETSNLEEHEITFKDGEIKLDNSKTIGTYKSRAEKFLAAYDKNIGNIRKIKKEEAKKWGVPITLYTSAFDEERELDFIEAVIRGSIIASNNKYGIKVTPEEVLTNTLHEGAILLFKKGYRYVPVDLFVEKGDKKIEYNGKTYPITWVNTGKKIKPIVTDILDKELIYLTIPDQEEIELYDIYEKKFKTYKIQTNKKERRFVELPKETIFMSVDEVSGYGKKKEIEYRGKMYPLVKNPHNPVHEYGIKVNNKILTLLNIGDVETENIELYNKQTDKFQQFKIHEGSFGKFIITPEKQKYYDKLPVELFSGYDSKKKIIYEGKEYDVIKNSEILKVNGKRATNYAINLVKEFTSNKLFFPPDTDKITINRKRYYISNRNDTGRKLWLSGKGTYYTRLNNLKKFVLDSEQYLGLDYIGERMPMLIEGNFVSENIEYKPFDSASDDRKTRPARFSSLNEAIEAAAGEYAYHKMLLLNDLPKYYKEGNISKPPEKYSDEEIFFWSAIYFNAGENTGRIRLKEFRGTIPYIEDNNKGYSSDTLVNAARRTAPLAVLKKLNLFK